MAQILIALAIAIVFYYIGLYRGMIKAKEICKKTYREFGIILPERLN
jgi:hypothetical protein